MAMSPRLLRPVASGFDPRRISGLEAWYDAADSASVTLDSGRVAEWRDKSGNGRHAGNSTSGSTQPDYITAGQNGRNLVRFVAASSQRLSVNSASAFNFLHNGTASYVAAVVSFGTTANPLAFYALCGNANGGQFSRGTVIGYDDRSGKNDRLWVSVASGSAVIVSADNSNYNGVFPAQQKVVFDALLDAGNATANQRLRARTNGGSEIAANTSTGTPSSDNAAGDFFLGSAIGTAPNPGLFMQGDICELLFFSQHPTAAAQDSIRRYLANKWGVTLYSPPTYADADVNAYISAVELEDGGLMLETGVRNAINDFITGCKADGIWSAIKASCILAGARTLAGALTPLVGTAPTNNGPFVSGDYDRKTGLVGNGTSKYLDSNRAGNADPQDSVHLAVYASTVTTSSRAYIGSGGGELGATAIADSGSTTLFARCRSAVSDTESGYNVAGLLGISRSASGSYVIRGAGASTTKTRNSDGAVAANYLVFGVRTGGGANLAISSARLAFYSIGESVDLALLDSRVSTLISAIGAAI